MRVDNMINKLKSILNSYENFDGIELWNVSNVTDMSCMFWGCENFNQPLNSWNVSNVTDMSDMFLGCGIDKKNLPKKTK